MSVNDCNCGTEYHCYLHDVNVCGDCGLHHSEPHCPECGCGEAEDAAYKEDEPDKFECPHCGSDWMEGLPPGVFCGKCGR